MSDKEAAHKTASANRCGNWEADNLADAYLELEAELAAERAAREQEAKAIRAAALEEAAKVCEKYEASAKTDDGWIYLATAIRSLK